VVLYRTEYMLTQKIRVSSQCTAHLGYPAVISRTQMIIAGNLISGLLAHAHESGLTKWRLSIIVSH
jgi:hypothetical protein